MEQYHELCREILDEGDYIEDRTGVGTYSITGGQMKFDLREGFPMLTTKRVPFKLIFTELLWFIKGDTNIRYLLNHNNNIWNEWPFKRWVESDEYDGTDMTDFGRRAEEDEEFKEEYKKQMEIFKEKIKTDDEFAEKFGDIGRGYGAQWRNAFYVDHETLEVSFVDQLAEAVEAVKQGSSSRRIIVSSFTTDNRRDADLPACHNEFQFLVRGEYLDLKWVQRSGDTFLGVPFNIASYGMLLEMVAHVAGLTPRLLVGQLGDVHIYSNHVEQVEEMLSREEKQLPSLWINEDVENLEDFDVGDLKLEGYDPHPRISAPVAV